MEDQHKVDIKIISERTFNFLFYIIITNKSLGGLQRFIERTSNLLENKRRCKAEK